MTKGTDISNNAISVKVEGGDVSLFGMNKVSGSCDSYVAFPVRYLAQNYYTVSHYPASRKTQASSIYYIQI